LGATDVNRKSVALGMIVFLMLGLGFGSIFFPRTVTQTTTQTTTQIATKVTTLTVTTNSSLAVVTATAINVLVEHVVATCTTISGTASIVYVYLVNGETTTITTVYPHLPPEFQVTLTTVSTVSVSNQTIISQPDTC
jgi:hypothetical protein